MEQTNSDTKENSILCVSFNQDTSCFAAGTQRGFRIFNTYPYKDNFERLMVGGIGIVEMLYRSNILALVGSAKNQEYTPNKVILWDDHQSKVISELRFNTNVKNVKLKKDKIFVICESKIYVFTFISFNNIDTIDTYENPKGIVAVNSDSKSTVLAYPDKTKGYVRVKSYDKAITTLINAHESSISFLCLNSDGSLVATASDKGTLIRIFKTDDGTFLQELRRGKEKAEIYSICFNPTSKFVASSSDRGTIHIWSLGATIKKLNETGDVIETTLTNEDKERDEESFIETDIPKNYTSFLSGLPSIFGGKYFKSEWSFAQLRIEDSKSICTFGPNNTIIAITSTGKYYQASFDVGKKNSECIMIQENIIDLSKGESNNLIK